jgi:hypothetical protein
MFEGDEALAPFPHIFEEEKEIYQIFIIYGDVIVNKHFEVAFEW